MSFPDKSNRETCWNARDKYWDCLTEHNIDDPAVNKDAPQCLQLRKLFESGCPGTWVTHFDRKRNYILFKEEVETKGYDPIKAQKSAENSAS